MIFSGNIFEKRNFVLKNDKREITFSKYGPEFKIDMKIKLKSYPSSGQFGNIFRVTAFGSNDGTKGDRYPALFVHPNRHFHFTTCIANDPNQKTDSSTAVALNRWYEISIEQRKSGSNIWSYQVYVNGKRLLSLVLNARPIHLRNAKLYLSDRFHEEAKVDFDYLRIFY